MTTRKLSDLKPNPGNPRTVTAQKKRMLAASLKRFGDLGGVVFNTVSNQLVGGHQRVDVMDGATINITKTHDKPDSQGTVAEGYIETINGRHAYREVAWDADTEKAANLAANKGAGEFDISEVANWLKDLEVADYELDLTMFDSAERELWAGKPAADSDWDDALSKVPSGEQGDIKTVTFTLTTEQHAVVMQRLDAMKALGPFVDTGNANNNGNALARLAELYSG
jgi:hypothetical protein